MSCFIRFRSFGRQLPVLALAFGLAVMRGAPQADVKPLMVNEVVARQLIRTKVDPEYPATARQFHISGEVVVQLTISAEGKVETVDSMTGNMLLQASVKSALKRWVFTPYVMDAKPTRIKTTLSFSFHL